MQSNDLTASWETPHLLLNARSPRVVSNSPRRSSSELACLLMHHQLVVDGLAPAGPLASTPRALSQALSRGGRRHGVRDLSSRPLGRPAALEREMADWLAAARLRPASLAAHREGAAVVLAVELEDRPFRFTWEPRAVGVHPLFRQVVDLLTSSVGRFVALPTEPGRFIFMPARVQRRLRNLLGGEGL